MHDLEFVRTIVSVKSGFPFVSVSNVDQVVGFLEINV